MLATCSVMFIHVTLAGPTPRPEVLAFIDYKADFQHQGNREHEQASYIFWRFGGLPFPSAKHDALAHSDAR